MSNKAAAPNPVFGGGGRPTTPPPQKKEGRKEEQFCSVLRLPQWEFGQLAPVYLERGKSHLFLGLVGEGAILGPLRAKVVSAMAVLPQKGESFI